jgi:hypothetical protein
MATRDLWVKKTSRAPYPHGVYTIPKKAAGRIAAYGWATHWHGGEWRRLEYTTGTDMGKMVDSRRAVIDTLMKDNRKAMEEFSGICSSHDDYLWSSVATSQAPDAVGRDRAAVAMSS